MTIEELVSKLLTVYQRNRNLLTDGPHTLTSTKMNAVAELRRAASVLLQDDSTEKRQEVEGAIYLCESLNVLSSKESEELVKELYEAK